MELLELWELFGTTAVPTVAQELQGNSEPQPGGSKFCSAPPLASELHWPSLFDSFGNWASFWSLPKLFFLRPELAPCAGQFRMFVCGSCTYLRNCLPLRCELAQRAGQFRNSVCVRFLHLSAGSLGTGVVGVAGVPGSFGFVSDFEASDLVIPHLSVGFLGHERVCRAVSALCVRFLHLSAGLSVAAL